MNENLGRVVLYTLSQQDEASINGRRSRNEPTVEAGQVCPMLITSEGYSNGNPHDLRASIHTVDGLVFLNGDAMPFFVRGRIFGNMLGEWHPLSFSEREWQTVETKARKLAVQV